MNIYSKNSGLTSIAEETQKQSSYDKLADHQPFLSKNTSYGFGWNHDEKRELQQLITTKYLNRQLMRDSILRPTNPNGSRGIFENVGLVKQFTIMDGSG